MRGSGSGASMTIATVGVAMVVAGGCVGRDVASLAGAATGGAGGGAPPADEVVRGPGRTTLFGGLALGACVAQGTVPLPAVSVAP